MEQEVTERSSAKFTDEHLSRLADIAASTFKELFAKPWASSRIYDGRLLMICLCQGAALHYIDGKNGVKDIDAWAFFDALPEMKFPPRNRWVRDFGPSEFGRHSDDGGFKGRRVDIMGRSIEVREGDTATSAVQRWFTDQPTTSAYYLAQKAAVAVYPAALRGTVIWPKHLEG